MKTENRKIKGYSKYALNEKNQVVNVNTGNVMQVKKASGKFQLSADKGGRKELTLDQIIALAPAKKAVTSSNKTTKKEPVEVEELLKRADVKKVMELTGPKHRKIYELDKLGLLNKEIQAVTGSTVQVVSRDLWMYKTGRLKAE